MRPPPPCSCFRLDPGPEASRVSVRL
jgi:hypothetical protein